MNPTILKPRMSEKSYAASADGVYVFDVNPSVNKQEIAKAVEQTYGVTVTQVRTVIAKGKKKRLFRKRRSENGVRSDVKKAYVTLKKGDGIPIFAAVEEAEDQAEKTSKVVEKAAEKQAKKESKKDKKEK